MTPNPRKSTRVKKVIYRTLNQTLLDQKRHLVRAGLPTITVFKRNGKSGPDSHHSVAFNKDDKIKSISSSRHHHRHEDGSRRHRSHRSTSSRRHRHHRSSSRHRRRRRHSRTLYSSDEEGGAPSSRASSSSSATSTSSASTLDSHNARRFRRKERRKILRARRRCLPMNFSLGDLAKNHVLKDRLRIGRSLTDIEPMTIDKNITFSEIGGLNHHIKSLKEMVLFPLLYPEVYETLNITPPRGVLFYGPPGTGKTLLARALVNECSLGSIQGDNVEQQQQPESLPHGGIGLTSSQSKISFFMRKGSDCLSKWVGESERQLRLLFDQAYKMRPSIIFFDEIDGLAPVRSSRQEQIHNSIVSTFLALLDGLDSRSNIVVIGATNRLDAIDPAFRRPGRFDREFLFPMPNRKVREKIFKIHTERWLPPLEYILLKELSAQTNGFTGADIKGLCTEAALTALRQSYPDIYTSQYRLEIEPKAITVRREHFSHAFETMIPCTLRHSSNRSLAREIPAHLAPLLAPQIKIICARLQHIFPFGKRSRVFKNTQKIGISSDEGEDFDQDKRAISRRKTTLVSKKTCNISMSTVEYSDIEPSSGTEFLSVGGDHYFEDCFDSIETSGHAFTLTSSTLNMTAETDYKLKLFGGRKRPLRNPNNLGFSHISRNRFDHMGLSSHKPRFILTGASQHDGQSTYLGPALLAEPFMDGLNISIVDLPTIFGGSGMKLPEETCNEIFREAQRLTPSVIYMPRLDAWWPTLSETTRVTLLGLIHAIPHNVPLLILATSDVLFDKLHSQVKEIFADNYGHQSKAFESETLNKGDSLTKKSKKSQKFVENDTNISVSKHHQPHVYQARKPSTPEKQQFFALLINEAFLTLRKYCLKKYIISAPFQSRRSHSLPSVKPPKTTWECSKITENEKLAPLTIDIEKINNSTQQSIKPKFSNGNKNVEVARKTRSHTVVCGKNAVKLGKCSHHSPKGKPVASPIYHHGSCNTPHKSHSPLINNKSVCTGLAPLSFHTRQLDESELKELRDGEEDTLRELRIFLRDILETLARDKRFATFSKPVNPREVPDYYVIVKNPMDLTEMRNKIDSCSYITPTQFLGDIELICRNALEYNPNYTAEDRSLRHRACALLDEARSQIRNKMEPSFERICDGIANSRRQRGDAHINTFPPFMKVPPKNLKEQIFSKYYDAIKYDLSYRRSRTSKSNNNAGNNRILLSPGGQSNIAPSVAKNHRANDNAIAIRSTSLRSHGGGHHHHHSHKDHTRHLSKRVRASDGKTINLNININTTSRNGTNNLNSPISTALRSPTNNYFTFDNRERSVPNRGVGGPDSGSSRGSFDSQTGEINRPSFTLRSSASANMGSGHTAILKSPTGAALMVKRIEVGSSKNSVKPSKTRKSNNQGDNRDDEMSDVINTCPKCLDNLDVMRSKPTSVEICQKCVLVMSPKSLAALPSNSSKSNLSSPNPIPSLQLAKHINQLGQSGHQINENFAHIRSPPRMAAVKRLQPRTPNRELAQLFSDDCLILLQKDKKISEIVSSITQLTTKIVEKLVASSRHFDLSQLERVGHVLADEIVGRFISLELDDYMDQNCTIALHSELKKDVVRVQLILLTVEMKFLKFIESKTGLLTHHS